MLRWLSLSCLALVACDDATARRGYGAGMAGAAGEVGIDDGSEGGASATRGGVGGGSLEVDGGRSAQAQGGATAASAGEAGAGGLPPRHSLYCGDAIRDPELEQCDDGPGDEGDTCSATCDTRSWVLSPPASADFEWDLGESLHQLASGEGGSGLIFSEWSEQGHRLLLARVNAYGQALGEPIDVSIGCSPADSANPVVAALPGGRYAVAWGDLGGGSLDVLLRTVSPEGELSEPLQVHSSAAGAQSNPDLLWNAGELVIAWTDDVSVKLRSFSQQLVALSPEQTVSGDAFAGSVSLAAHTSGWVAAFRELAHGAQAIVVRLADGNQFTLAPIAPSAPGERVAVVSLDEERLVVAYSAQATAVGDSGATTYRLHAALLNADEPKTSASLALQVALEPFASDAGLAQRRPTLSRAGSQWFLAWQSESPVGDPLSEEVFLRELEWSPDTSELVALPERLLVPDAASEGVQAMPLLAEAAVVGSSALAVAFADEPIGGAGRRLVLGLLPTPFVEPSSSKSERLP